VPLPRRSRTRDPSEVAGRAAALRALVLAAAGEGQPAGNLAFTPRERALLARPVADWSPQDVVDVIWHGEALGTLAWSLALEEELPGYDEPFDHVALARRLELGAPKPRPFAELEQARETARLWHWRARSALLHENGSLELPEHWRSFDQLVAAAAMRGFEDGLLPTPVRGDFPALGKVYRHLDPEQRALLHSIAAERHYALVWLLGHDPWDEVETDT
jgi:hypothetical protein